ncbi:MAG: hypothetical protein AUJ85_03755 [Elusimicrobia bacterium CG1_02_37_114]|nr:MAG: hypothetical protein AUJ85_03755 [Elusimicrobia bacterium CG1_02_37_114]PIV52807.1 MAG: hypothetical protein COS17_07235 [Elusimicrobia bacterium CG02_land_8_20_14_3_00_37_13]PIZ13383.1 MAG: hypothetical protein COY53_05105 [Elusimicrobia bacterium CG_4_10_14_0_8_um_filter_37_32]
MGDFEKHIKIAKEKIGATKEAFAKKNNTVVGDLAIKVVEQLVEADIARKGEHFGDHKSRHAYSNKEFPEKINNSMRRIWFAYGDLGYDGVNGKRAKIVMENLEIVIKFFEARFGVKIQ